MKAEARTWLRGDIEDAPVTDFAVLGIPGVRRLVSALYKAGAKLVKVQFADYDWPYGLNIHFPKLDLGVRLRILNLVNKKDGTITWFDQGELTAVWDDEPAQRKFEARVRKLRRSA